MKLTILGSAAAEGIPAAFCGCPTCTEAWKRGGKDLRLRSAYMLNERVRVDFGPDSLAQEYRYGLHSEKLRHLIVTHSHEDHLYNALFDYRRKGFSAVPEGQLLTVYGNPGVIESIRREVFHADFEEYQMKLLTLEAFHPLEIPEEDMTIYPLSADHMPSEKPMIYILRQGKRHILIGNDTGYFPEDTWNYLSTLKLKLSVAILDCTGGATQSWRRNHMGGTVPIEVRDHLKSIGLLDDSTQVYVNHYSHNGHSLQSDLESFYQKHGISVGYDGCVIEY